MRQFRAFYVQYINGFILEACHNIIWKASWIISLPGNINNSKLIVFKLHKIRVAPSLKLTGNSLSPFHNHFTRSVLKQKCTGQRDLSCTSVFHSAIFICRSHFVNDNFYGFYHSSTNYNYYFSQHPILDSTYICTLLLSMKTQASNLGSLGARPVGLDF